MGIFSGLFTPPKPKTSEAVGEAQPGYEVDTTERAPYIDAAYTYSQRNATMDDIGKSWNHYDSPDPKKPPTAWGKYHNNQTDINYPQEVSPYSDEGPVALQRKA